MTMDEKVHLAQYDCAGILIEALLKIRDKRCGIRTPDDVADEAISDWDYQRGIASRKVCKKT